MWPAECRVIEEILRRTLGSRALRIDHIGSTAVPGLPAKDIIDVQVTAGDLSDAGLVSVWMRYKAGRRTTVR
ncbi:GrpB family protein [Saccharospirillum sp.]|uniref:GrpB family protein n=1 Tax=Saccharospirillum sp. TaxID=2033801 RepID=UPI0034A05C0D